MRRFLLFLISLLIGIGLFIWIIKTVGWQEIKNAFLVFTGWQGIIILILTFLIILFGILEWKVILKGLRIDISFRDLSEPYLAGFSIMYLAPMLIFGKEIFRGYLLKKKNSVPWLKGAASVILDRILDFTTELVFIFVGIIIFLLLVGPPLKNLAIFCGGVILFSMIGMSFFYFKIFKRASIIKFFIRPFIHKYQNDITPLHIEEEVFNFFRIKNRNMWQGFFLTFLEKVIKLFRTWFLLTFLGEFIGFLRTFPILSFSYLVAMIPIPAQLGSQEGIQALIFTSLGLMASKGVAFSMITKGAELIIALIGVFIFLKLGPELLRNSQSK